MLRSLAKMIKETPDVPWLLKVQSSLNTPGHIPSPETVFIQKLVDKRIRDLSPPPETFPEYKRRSDKL